MDLYINQIKPQLNALISDKKYNIADLKLEEFDNIIKIYYKKRFVKYIDTKKIKIDAIKRPFSDEWIKFKKILMSEIVKIHTYMNNFVTIIPVYRNHNLLQKCIICLQKQTLKTDIILLVSSDEDKNFALINGFDFVNVPKTSLINVIKTGTDYIKNNTDYQYLMLCFHNDILLSDWTKEGVKLLEKNDMVGGQQSLIVDRISDNVYSRKINNDKAKILIGSVNDLIFNSGKIIKRNLLDRIRTNIMKDSLEQNDLTLFNTVLNGQTKIGIIDNLPIIKIITDGTVSDHIRKYGNSSYNDYEKLKFIPNKEMELLSKLEIKKIDSADNNENNDANKVIDTTEKKEIIKFTNNTNMFNNFGINQIKISSNLSYMADRIKKAYNLDDYIDRHKPSLFYGIFNDEDIQSIRDHKEKKYVLWDGEDILHLKKEKDDHLRIISRIKRIPDIIHISPSAAVYTILQSHGIYSSRATINFSFNDDKFENILSKFGNNVLIYNGFNSDITDDNDRFNKKIYEQLIKKMPDIKFLFTNKLKLSYNDIFRIYKECFIGLRLCKLDGVSQFVTDLLKLGIPVIHNGEYENTIKWKTIDDIITTIRSVAPIKELPKKYITPKSAPKLSDMTFNLSNEENKNVISSIRTNNIFIKYSFKNDTIYSIKIRGFKSSSKLIKITTVTLSNDNYVLVDSYLSSDLYINLNYIDTNIYKNLKQLIINDNVGTEYCFDMFTINEISKIDAQTEAYESKILDIKEVEIYKTPVQYKYKVACIMDIFTYTCFSYEINLIQVKQEDWLQVLKENMIDFFIFESAWHGNNGSWDKQLTIYNLLDDSAEIKKLIKYLNKNNIPKIFYNKEDPFNYDIFSSFAKEFNCANDLVVTTDENMIDKYKSLGCSNVSAFPFCCQPIIHNPIDKEDDNDNRNIIFPCSYYGVKYPDRCKHMNEMIDAYIDKIDIFDRQFIFNKQTRQIQDFHKYKNWYEFPEKYKSRIKGSLNYEQVVSLYRKYKAVMNTNTATDSRTMFSRRAIEAAASGVPIISDHALGIECIFGDTAIYYDETEKVNMLLNDITFRKSISDKIYKKVMHNYTYKHLIKKFTNHLSNNNNEENDNLTKNILCLIFIENMENINNFKHIMDNYEYNIISNNISDSNYKIIKYDEISNISKSFDYYFIINGNCTYEENYIKNMLLPTLYTDAIIIGKGAYRDNDNNIISSELEHRFSNRLNVNTIVMKNTEDVFQLFNNNLISNIETYMNNNFNGKNMYSADMFDFIDADRNYHYFDKYEIEMEHIIAKGVNITQVTPIIMCCYNRINLISETIKCLNNQTDKNFILYLWNNKYSEKDKLTDIISKSNANFNIICHHSKENVGGIGRFYMIRELLKTKDYKYTIFIDDDQHLDRYVIEKFKKAAKHNHSYNWYGRKFIKGEPYANIYTDGHVKLNSQPINVGDEYDYGGTGGMIIDTSIFTDDNLFRTLPRKYKFVEDLWMSYYGITKLDYKFIKIDQGISQIKDGKDQCSKIWDVKNSLLQYCRSHGWNV